MSKKNEVITAIDTVVTKGDDFLGKAKDFIVCAEILITATTGLKAVLDEMITAGQKIIEAANELKAMFSETAEPEPRKRLRKRKQSLNQLKLMQQTPKHLLLKLIPLQKFVVLWL